MRIVCKDAIDVRLLEYDGLCHQIAILRLQTSEKMAAAAAPLVIPVRHKQKQQRFRSPQESGKVTGQKWISKKKEVIQKPKDTRGTDNPVWKARVPIDDVFIRTYYPRQELELEETVRRHREYAVPDMLDSEDSFVYADIELDMTTTKKTKFLGHLKETIFLPHFFDDGKPRRCILFSKSDEDVTKALELGAVAAGGATLIQQMLKEEISKDEYEFVLCTPDILTDLVPLRKMLRDNFPAKQKGSLSLNVEEMMSQFSKSLSCQSQKVTDAVSKVQIPFGRLDMSTEELIENFQQIVRTVSEHRPKMLGPIIQKISIISPPSDERFQLRLEGNVPGYVTKQAIVTLEDETTEDNQEDDSDDEAEKTAAKR